MSAPAIASEHLRQEAARIAFALIRFDEVLAYPPTHHTAPGEPVVGTDAYVFMPSGQAVPRQQVEDFLVSLPSPALLSPTLTRGMVALTLVHELGGDRRRWAEKTLSNFTNGFDELSAQLHLSADSRILLEFDSESHVLSHPGVRLWTHQFAVQVGWVLRRLDHDPRAEARLQVRRSDGAWSPPLTLDRAEGRGQPPN